MQRSLKRKWLMTGTLAVFGFAVPTFADFQGPPLNPQVAAAPIPKPVAKKKKPPPSLVDKISDLFTYLKADLSDLQWGSDKNKSEDSNAMNSDKNSKEKNSGKNSSLGKKGGSDSPKDKESLVFRDDTPKGQDPSGNHGAPPPRGGQPPSEGTGNNRITDKSKVHDRWWPLCLLMDPTFPDPDKLIKGMMEIADQCNVNLVVFPSTLKAGYSADPKKFVSQTVSSCNLQGKVPGASEASSLLVHNSDDAAPAMCKQWKPEPPFRWHTPDPDKATGCAQLRSGSRGGKNGLQGMSVGGAVAPGVISPGGWSPAVAMHEAIGHSEMGELNGPMLGLGIGEDPNSTYNDKEIGMTGGFYPSGCQIFHDKALPNDGRWRYDPTQTSFYTKETDPAKQLTLGDPMFGRIPPDPPNDPPRIISSREPPRGSGGDELFFKDDTKKAEGETAGPVGPGHKKPPGSTTGAETSGQGDDANSIISLRRGGGDRSPASDPSSPTFNGETGNGQDSASLTFNENAKKDGSSGDVTPSTVGGSKNGASLTFNDNASKLENAGNSDNQNSGSGSEGSGGPRVKGKKPPAAPAKLGGSLDDDFFNFMTNQRVKRRKKGSTLRANQNLPEARSRLETN
jgi:hypothetical protein